MSIRRFRYRGIVRAFNGYDATAIRQNGLSHFIMTSTR
jgi:hypothetical protein